MSFEPITKKSFLLIKLLIYVLDYISWIYEEKEKAVFSSEIVLRAEEFTMAANTFQLKVVSTSVNYVP